MSAHDVAGEARAWLACWRLRLRHRLRYRATVTARLDHLEACVDAALLILADVTGGPSLAAGSGYRAAVDAQARRRGMHRVETEKG